MVPSLNRFFGTHVSIRPTSSAGVRARAERSGCESSSIPPAAAHLAGPAGLPASLLQASGFRGDVTVFRLNARPPPKTGSDRAFRRNEAERVYIIEGLITRRSQVQILPPLPRKAPETGSFSLERNSAEILMMSDTLADGIIHQFPGRLR